MYFCEMKREVILTADGSKTIYIPEMDENYHSMNGAFQEAMHVFIQNGIRTFNQTEEITVFEMGFGTGLNALLTLVEAVNSNRKINYIGIEAFPVELELIKEINYEKLVDIQFIDSFSLMHSLSWEEKHILHPNFTFQKIHAKIQDYKPLNSSTDIVFFDAFGPKVQQEVWTIGVLKKMHDMLKPNGILVTYCAMGQMKRDLKFLGFKVEGLPGPPGKREMTRAVKL
jgi:tRNA U34 5-methylaminomethyl-2-thiouridine-forming methyltransferase MnmC